MASRALTGQTSECALKAEFFDLGGQIGLIVTYGGQHRVVRVANPWAAEMDADWRRAHPDYKPVAKDRFKDFRHPVDGNGWMTP